MSSVYCIIELFTPYNEYGDRQSLGFVGRRSDGIFCSDYNKYGAHKFTEDEASSYVKQLTPHYTVKVYHYGAKVTSKPKNRTYKHRITVMKRINKYLYLYVVQGDYGHGWEDLIASESYREALTDLRAYRQEDSYACGHRIIRRREINPEYKG